MSTAGGKKSGGKKSGKGLVGAVLPNSAPVTIKTTAGIARGLLQAVGLGKPFTGPGVNPLIRALSQAVIVSSTGKKSGVGKKPGPGKSVRKGTAVGPTTRTNAQPRTAPLTPVAIGSSSS